MALARSLGQTRLGDVDVRRLRKFLGRRPCDRATTAREIATLRRFFLGLLREGRIATSPAHALARPKLPRDALPAFLSVELAARLVEAPDRTSLLGARDRALLELLYATGIQSRELVALEVEDLALELPAGDGLAELVVAGRNARTLPVGSFAAGALRDYLPRRPELLTLRPLPHLFVAPPGAPLHRVHVAKIVAEYAKRALGRSVTPLELRHSCAVHLVDGGADLMVVKAILGFGSVRQTVRYLGAAIGALTAVYDQAHPLAGVRRRRATPRAA